MTIMIEKDCIQDTVRTCRCPIARRSSKIKVFHDVLRKDDFINLLSYISTIIYETD